MKILYTFLVLSLLLQAQTLQETIEYSLQNNYQLRILEEESAILGKQSEIESTWADPILKVGINDLQADHPLSRNIEAMQNQFVSLSQIIPLSNRVELSSAIEREKQKVFEEKREILNVNIAFTIRKAFIEAKNSEKNLALLDEYINFLETPLKLIVNLSAVEQNSVEQYITTALLQESYMLQRQNWLERIAVAKERIKLIGNLNINGFSNDVVLKHYHQQREEKLLHKLEQQSPELKMVLALQDVAKKGIELAKAQEQADITLTGGYYQRFDRNDYVSFTVAMPLFTHNKQEHKRVQAMRRANIQEISYAKTKVALEQGLKITLRQLKTLYQELEILHESQQKIDKLITNAEAELVSGGSLLHYYELFSKRVNNRLAINIKRLAIALNENQIDQLLGVTQ
jgi:outer membrane protein TolC